MRILITGGTGFIGCYFVRALLDRGHDLTVLDLHPFESSQDGRDFTNVHFVQGDVRDSETVNTAMKGCDAVLHLAAAHHDFGITEATFESVNVDGAQVICDAMEQQGIYHCCFFSTVAIYGQASPPVLEDTPPQPSSPYGETKRRGEEVFRDWAARNENRRCTVIRPTVTFGAGNFANMFTLIHQIERGLFVQVGDGSNIKSLSYVENTIEATLHVWFRPPAEQPSFAVFSYVCKPDLSSREIANTIYRALGKNPPRFRIPYLAARVLAFPMDLIIALTGKNLPVSGARIKKLAKTHTEFESQAIRDAGFEQKIGLEDGIKKMVAWYLKSGKQESLQGVKRRLPPPT